MLTILESLDAESAHAEPVDTGVTKGPKHPWILVSVVDLETNLQWILRDVCTYYMTGMFLGTGLMSV